jgi:NitT/TauT family transport system permease protein
MSCRRSSWPPGKALIAGLSLLTEYGFAGDIGVTVWRVVGGFLIAAAVAVPLGLMMGAFKPVEAFFEPFISFARYLPASAFIPLLILWAGGGRGPEALAHLHRHLLPDRHHGRGHRRRHADGPGGSRLYARRASRGILRRVIIPSSAPQVMETLRLVLGWAWTYVIVAELIGATSASAT